MKKNKCDDCQNLENLRQRIHDLSSRLEVEKRRSSELQSELNFYRLNSIPISLEEKFTLWEWHNQRVQTQQEEDESKRNDELNRLIDVLER